MRGGARAGAPRLFAREELRLRPTGMARLSAIARRPQPRLTASELHRKEEAHAVAQLRDWGADLARSFGLRYSAIDRERDGVTGHYGICYEDGLIRIRLRHAVTGRLLKESSLVDTLCHELAHLRHMNHGLRFRRLYRRILDRARESEIYRPGTQGGERPKQRSLFDDAACGTTAARGGL